MSRGDIHRIRATRTEIGRTETNWTGVAFGVWIGILAAFQQFKLPPALPLLLDRYGYDPTLAGGFMSVYAVAGLVLSLHVGEAMQRHGAGPFLAAAFGLFGIGNLLGLLWPESGGLVLVGRGLEGVGFIVLAILCSVFANISISPRHLPVAAALVATWIPGGQLLANLMAPWFLARDLWAPLWWIALAATVATAVWAWVLDRTGRVPFRFGPPPAPAQGGTQGPAPGSAADSARGPGSGASSGVRVLASEPSPRERLALWLTAATFMLWTGQMYAFLTWTPEFLVAQFGFDAATAAQVYTAPIVVILIGNFLGGALLRWGASLPALMVAVMVGQSFFWWQLPKLGANAGGLTMMLIYGLLAGITPTCLFAAPATILGTARAGGRAFGLLHLGRSAGVLVGPVLMAVVSQRLGGWTATAPIFGGITLAASAAGLVLTHLMRR
jgi:predicted MFS family arabinose efflux permease